MNALENTIVMFASDNGASAEIMGARWWSRSSSFTRQCRDLSLLGPRIFQRLQHSLSASQDLGSRRRDQHSINRSLAQRHCRQERTAPHSRHVIDFVPTALELAGVTKPEQWQGTRISAAPGKSLLPAMSKDFTMQRQSLWWLHEGNRAVRVGDWKLVSAAEGPWELYDLSIDRAEQNNLASQMPDRVLQLEKIWQQQTDDFTKGSFGRRFDRC